MNIRLAFVASLLIASPALTPLQAEPEVHVLPTSAPTFPELPPALPLWSGAAPGSEAFDSPLVMEWQNYQTTWYAVVTNINVPAIIPFLPAAGTGTGQAIVVCPGGGHRNLAMEHEGYAVGTWLAAHGIAAFVLEYRLARAPGSTYTVNGHALMDAQRAIRTIRSRASEWKVNPHQVGIIGFSAGGEVAAMASTRFATPVKGSADAIDALDCRPDFQGLFYPGLAADFPPPGSDTPPTFFCGAHTDPAVVRMVAYYEKLDGAGVSTELHVYAHGNHGFGIRDEDKPVYSWMGLFKAWLTALNKTPNA
jgi:acetyl esterase/lipase